MLTLTRKPGDRIVIGDDVEITIVDAGRGKVRVGIRAPRGVSIHRGEVLDRIIAENRAAAAAAGPSSTAGTPTRIEVPQGLPGLRAHRTFELYDVEGHPALRQLVSVTDPLVSLCIVDAELAVPGYPVAAARRLAPTSSDDVVVVLVATVPRDGRPPTFNTIAPVVIDVATCTAAQVVLEGVEIPGAVRAA